MKVNFIIIACLLVLVGWFGYQNNRLRTQYDAIEQNFKAATDSLHIYQLENESLLYEKDSYILKESELNGILDITQQEIKEIKRKLNSSIDYISKLEGMVKIDTIHMTDTIYYNKDSIPTTTFGYKDEWLILNGSTNFNPLPQTTITNIQVPIMIETGLTTDDNIFVKTNNPYVIIKDIKGAIIDDKKFKFNFHHEFQVGIGFQYGLFNKNIDFGPQIGYGFVIEF